VGITKQEEQESKSLRFDRQHLASFNKTELALSDFYIGESENKELMFRHEFVTPFQGRIMNPFDFAQGRFKNRAIERDGSRFARIAYSCNEAA
jgi:hypothetical protein